MKTPLMIAASLLIAQPAFAQEGFEIPPPPPPPTAKMIQQQSLDQLPPTNTEGRHIVQDRTVQRNIGYNPSRAWEPGTKSSEMITVGDVSVSSGKKITLRDTAPYSGRNLNQIKLRDVGPISQASLADLVKAYPELGRMRANQVPLLNNGNAQPDRIEKALGPEGAAAVRAFAAKYPLLEDLPLRRISKGKWDAILEGGAQIALVELSRKYPVLADIRIKDLKSIEGLARTGLRLYDRFSNGETVNEVIRNEPTLSQVPLGALFDLEKEGVDAIPGIENVALETIPGAKESAVERVPGMKNVPIDKLFGGQLSNVMLAQFDLAHSGDQIAPEVLSGETPLNKFRIKACNSNKPGGCSNIELIKLSGWPIPGVHGKRWVEGKDQIVDGCINSLCKVANKEQAGIKFNDALNWKVILMKVDEGGGGKPATATFGVAFQLRYRDLNGIPHASSHYIGPFPASTVPVKTPIAVAADLSPTHGYGSSQADNDINPNAVAQQVALHPRQPGDSKEPYASPCTPRHVAVQGCILHNPSPGAIFYAEYNLFGADRPRCPRERCHIGLDLFSPGASPNIHALEQGIFEKIVHKPACGIQITSKYPKVRLRMINEHAKQVLVKVGQAIERGQPIAKEGAPPSRKCGRDAHNHFQLNKNFTTPINPACYKYQPPLPQKGVRDGASLWRYSKKC